MRAKALGEILAAMPESAVVDVKAPKWGWNADDPDRRVESVELTESGVGMWVTLIVEES